MKAPTARRVAWSIGIASIALMAGALVLMFVDRHVALPTDASSDRWTFSNVLSDLVNILVPAIGIVLASRRPENRIGWLFLSAGLALGLATFGTSYGVHGLLAHRGSLPAGRGAAWVGNGLGLIPLGLLAFLFLLFPTGHLRSPGWRPAAWFVGGAFALFTGISVVAATEAWNDPLGQRSSSGLVASLAFALPLIAALVVSLVAVVVRFRRSVGDERLQLKWFVSAAALLVAMFVASFLTSSHAPAVVSILQSVAFVALWSAIAVAVLKYRLYGIDVVINRAVVYGTLAIFITLVYVGLVVGVGTVVGNRRSPLLSAVAAAVIAVAFQPVRERSRRFANRLVYGKRATPYEVLSDFAERISGAYASEDVLPRMAQIVAAGTGAERTLVWLRVGEELRAEASSDGLPDVTAVRIEGQTLPSFPPGETAVPVMHQGELLGTISVRMPKGEVLDASGERLIADVASQAGLVLSNARLIEELRASRQRLVTAQDAARRRLERNIHDGAQQQLVALAVKLNLAERLIGRDEERERAMIVQLKAEAADALETLRDLARGIYPPLLADRGLTAALEAQARKSPVPVRVASEGISRYGQDAEAAVYFSVLEGLQNVAKYAGASTVVVRLSQADGQLCFEVTDDGVGFDAERTTYGTGLQGIADRLAALDGTLEVRSSPGAGTTLQGTVPVQAPT